MRTERKVIRKPPKGGPGRRAGGAEQEPFLSVSADVAAVEYGRRHHPVQHRREIQIRRGSRGGVRIGIDIQEIFAACG